ncbi:MAG TPA: VIT domain-containing protein [Thermoanaerobaculia bacterium]|nr:VIT domain-containing protein [Thermoanaerobaculia bacterium]
MSQQMPSPVVEAPRSGLQAGGSAVPLLGVSVEAELKGFAARVTLSQRYRNDGETPLEATYVFPLDETAAVCGFEALVDGRVIAGKVLEREKAFEAYDEAISAGHGAYLLDEERPDVFTASIGNLPPGKEVVVRLTTVAELRAEGDGLRFTLPTTVSPRYAPAEDRRGVGRTPEETLNPPVAFRVPYGLSLRVKLDMPSAIRGIESPSHPVSIDLDGSRGTVTLGTAETALDRDFVLVVRLAESARPAVLVERAPDGTHVAMLTFAPRFGEGRIVATDAAKGEIVFVVDRSGSMNGSSIEEARNALQLCLRSLPAGILFNIVGFGSTFQKLFPKSRHYDEKSLAEASAHVKALKADLGGTEILPALESILKQSVPEGALRQLFLLTDGQVSNTDEVLALVREHAATSRAFTFGIGAGASAHLVKGLARAGGGEAEMIAPGERIEAKVLRQLARALAPALGDLRVDWGEAKVKQAPHRVPPVFDGERVVVYGFLEGNVSGDVVLRAKAPAGELAFPARLETAEAPEGTLLATLAARTLIRDLEEGASPLHNRRGSLQGRNTKDRVKEEIVRLGVTYGLVSRETSYVAIEERADPETGEMTLRKVPIALTRGWGGLEPGGDVMLSAAPPAMLMESSVSSLRLGSVCLSRARPRDFGDATDKLRRISSAPAARAVEATRPLDRLVALQKADGFWDLDEEIATLLGTTLREVEEALAGTPGDPVLLRRAAATALALSWLERSAADAEDEWRLLARKASAWLDASGVLPPDGGPWRVFAAVTLGSRPGA